MYKALRPAQRSERSNSITSVAKALGRWSARVAVEGRFSVDYASGASFKFEKHCVYLEAHTLPRF